VTGARRGCPRGPHPAYPPRCSAQPIRSHAPAAPPVKSVSSENFGLVVAYVLPGFVLLWGLQPVLPSIELFLGAPAGGATSVGGFLSGAVAALGLGMTASTVRWLVVDAIHHATGLRPPPWDFSRLEDRAAAFDIVVEHYYRYYQFHANLLVALVAVWVVRRWPLGPVGWGDLGFVALLAVLLAGSRDSLRRYYTGRAVAPRVPWGGGAAAGESGQADRGRRTRPHGVTRRAPAPSAPLQPGAASGPAAPSFRSTSCQSRLWGTPSAAASFWAMTMLIWTLPSSTELT
jgi:hypothetical protein